MFGSKKNKRKKLESQYRQLMEEAYRLSHVDRKKSDDKRAEAEKIQKKLDELTRVKG